MSRKSVLITIRKNTTLLNLSNFSDKFYLLGINFIKSFSQLFLKKNVLLVNGVLNFSQNKIFLSGQLFFTTKILKNYKRETILFSSKLQKQKKIRLEASILRLFKTLNIKFDTNLIFCHFLSLNNFYNKKFILYMFKKFKPYVFTLFRRRFNLYVDFIKLTSLFFLSKIDIGTYLYAVTNIFRYLQKRSHSKFSIFFKQFINYAIFINAKKLKSDSNIQGLKLVISGRFKGKTRSNPEKIQIGSVPAQSFNKTIEYSKRYTFTKKFGVFGFKMWVYKI
jgi:hypothetical protein